MHISNMMLHLAYMFDLTAWRALILHYSDMVKKWNNYESEAQCLQLSGLGKKPKKNPNEIWFKGCLINFNNENDPALVDLFHSGGLGGAGMAIIAWSPRASSSQLPPNFPGLDGSYRFASLSWACLWAAGPLQDSKVSIKWLFLSPTMSYSVKGTN